MTNPFRPLIELVNGDAYEPHSADAALTLGRRFAGRTIAVVGGGGTGVGWTQRVRFEHDRKAMLEGKRSISFKRGSSDWHNHLAAEAGQTSGWAVLLIEQQWQATVSSASAASVGTRGVEGMLRVRESISSFGDDRLSEDAVRAAVDHPTMEGSIVAGVRSMVLEPLEAELRTAGFEIAAVRIGVISLLEVFLERLKEQQLSPDRTLVVHDGSSALVIGVRDGAFDATEGGLSYLVNRQPSELQAQIGRRLAGSGMQRDTVTRVTLVGAPLEVSGVGLEDVEIEIQEMDTVFAAICDLVRHDLRSDLQEMREALPKPVRWGVLSGMSATIGSVVMSALLAGEAYRLRDQVQVAATDHNRTLAAIAATRGRQDSLKREESQARAIAAWVDKNYHAQALIHSFLSSLPTEVSLDVVTLQAAEGLPQAKLRFSLLGGEDTQRVALRALEARLYEQGFQVAKRDDPALSTNRRGAVVYAWDLILPSFGSISLK